MQKKKSIPMKSAHPSLLHDGIAFAMDASGRYLHQVGSFSRLTAEEEGLYTRQFATSRETVHEILNVFPALILHEFRSVCSAKQEVRVHQMVTFRGESEEDTEGAESAPGDGISGVLASLEAYCAAYPSEMLLKPTEEFLRGFHGVLSPLVFHDLFYDECLRLMQEPDSRKMLADARRWARREASLREACRLKLEARTILVERNLRLVIAIAQNYARDPVSVQDLIQEGNIGLMRAVEKFDYTRGHRLSTYASYWIRQAITRSITRHSRVIRISSTTIKHLTMIRHADAEIFHKTGVPATLEQLSEQTGMPVQKVRALIKMSQQPISLQAALSEDAELADVIPDHTAPHPQAVAAQHALRASVVRALDVLDEREKFVIVSRYGLDDSEPMTFVEIAKGIGVTPERARQIELSAMRKLRSKQVVHLLDGYP